MMERHKGDNEVINETDAIGPNEAKDALNSINDLKSVSLRRGIPPWWFGLVITLSSGVVVALAAMEISRIYMAPIFLLTVFAVVYQTRKAGVLVRPFFSKRVLILLMVGVAAILVPLIFVARELRDSFGLFAPLSLGVSIFLIGLIAFAVERRIFLTKIRAEKK